MELKNKHHQSATDFYFNNKTKIAYTKKTTLIIMMSLKKGHKIISHFDEVRFSVDNNLNLVIVIYKAYLPTGFDFRVTFKISLSDSPSGNAVVEIKSFCNRDITVKAGSFSKKDDIVDLIQKRISTMSFGLESEAIFYQRFLLPFKKRLPNQIIFVHYAGKNNDLKKGVDFEVGFRPVGQHNTFSVDFNLKSSDRYLEDHKRKHPKVSTFIFKRNFLFNWNTLKVNFFHFLNEVIKLEVAHH